jgi:hypothetical protein
MTKDLCLLIIWVGPEIRNNIGQPGPGSKVTFASPRRTSRFLQQKFSFIGLMQDLYVSKLIDSPVVCIISGVEASLLE